MILPSVDSLVFDLDGTLWDSCASCAMAWNLVLARHGIEFREITADDVRKVAGKQHDACIRDTFVGLQEAELRTLIDETLVEDSRMIALHGGALFPGVHDGLLELAKSYPLFIVSNCQAGYIELFLQLSALQASFRDVECWGNTGRPKPDNLQALIARNRLASPWFIGDALSDLQAADACGVPFVHAAYGFGALEPSSARRLDAASALRLREFMDLPRALANLIS